MKPADVTITIERVILEGFGDVDALQFHRALEHQLHRLLSSPGGVHEWRSSSPTAGIDAGEIDWTTSRPIDANAAAVAQALYQGLVR